MWHRVKMVGKSGILNVFYEMLVIVDDLVLMCLPNKIKIGDSFSNFHFYSY